MSLVVLLAHQLFHFRSHFFTDLNGLLISSLWVEGALLDGVNELGSLGTLQDTRVSNFLELSKNESDSKYAYHIICFQNF